MVMGKSFKVWHKVNSQGPYSVLLEQRGREEALLFESLVIAALGPSEVEVVKKPYTKLLDAYGCLGVLPVSSGDAPLHYLLALHSLHPLFRNANQKSQPVALFLLLPFRTANQKPQHAALLPLPLFRTANQKPQLAALLLLLLFRNVNQKPQTVALLLPPSFQIAKRGPRILTNNHLLLLFLLQLL